MRRRRSSSPDSRGRDRYAKKCEHFHSIPLQKSHKVSTSSLSVTSNTTPLNPTSSTKPSQSALLPLTPLKPLRDHALVRFCSVRPSSNASAVRSNSIAGSTSPLLTAPAPAPTLAAVTLTSGATTLGLAKVSTSIKFGEVEADAWVFFPFFPAEVGSRVGPRLGDGEVEEVEELEEPEEGAERAAEGDGERRDGWG